MPSAPGRGTLFIALDGAMVHTKQSRDGHQGGYERNVGVWARFEPNPLAEDDEGAKSSDGPVDDGMGFEPQANCLARRYAHAVSAGLEDPACRPIVLVADGAH